MIKGNWVDHLYKYIEIDSETLKFINSTPIRDKVSRLSGLSQLGLISKVFPSAIHTKLEHNLGVYFLAQYLLDCDCCPKGIIKPLPFKIAAIIHGIGHFPFSLVTEVAVQKIAFLNETVRSFINPKIEPVIDRITKDIDKKKQNRFRNQIIKGKEWVNHFYRFFTAFFLLDNETMLRQVLDNSGSELNFDELLKYLSFPENVGFRLLFHIDRLDYVLRDMFHLGLIKIDLNLTPYFKNLKVLTNGRIEFPLEWRDALKKIESYAVRKIYNDPRVKAIEGIYEKLLMKMISDSEIALADFLKWEDDELERKMQTYQKEKSHKYKLFEQINKVREEFNDLPRYYFSRSNNVVSSKNLLLIEGRSKTIRKTLLKEIDKSIDNGIFKGSYFVSFSDDLDICVNLVCLEKSQIKPFLIEVGLYEKRYKKIDKNQIAQCIWGDHFGKIDFSRYNSIIEKLFAELEQKKGLTTLEIARQMFTPFLPKHLSREPIPEELLEAMRRITGISEKKVFLTNPEDKLFGKGFLQGLTFSDNKDFLSFVKRLCDKKVRITDFKGRAFEYLIYLRKAGEPKKRDDQMKKWVFPSTTITKRGDLDVWTLYVFNKRRPLVELIECSITTNSTKKLDATNKLNQKKEILQERFGTKVEVKTFFNDKELDE